MNPILPEQGPRKGGADVSPSLFVSIAISALCIGAAFGLCVATLTEPSHSAVSTCNPHDYNATRYIFGCAGTSAKIPPGDMLSNVYAPFNFSTPYMLTGSFSASNVTDVNVTNATEYYANCFLVCYTFAPQWTLLNVTVATFAVTIPAGQWILMFSAANTTQFDTVFFSQTVEAVPA